MKTVDNLCSICLLHEQPKRQIHNFWLHHDYYVCASIKRKCFAGNFINDKSK